MISKLVFPPFLGIEFLEHKRDIKNYIVTDLVAHIHDPCTIAIWTMILNNVPDATDYTFATTQTTSMLMI